MLILQLGACSCDRIASRLILCYLRYRRGQLFNGAITDHPRPALPLNLELINTLCKPSLIISRGYAAPRVVKFYGAAEREPPRKMFFNLSGYVRRRWSGNCYVYSANLVARTLLFFQRFNAIGFSKIPLTWGSHWICIVRRVHGYLRFHSLPFDFGSRNTEQIDLSNKLIG